ncbi:MAG TPA: transaldolase family protein, partial [Gemmataceae bacterium]
SPELLDELQRTPGELSPQLTREAAKNCDEPQLHLDEKTFRWMHNEDAMAVEKLSEGIRKFYADTRKLEQYVREHQLPRALAAGAAG